MTSAESDIRFSAFLTALFEKVDEVISDPESCIRWRIAESPDLTDEEKKAALENYPESLAGQFRLLMTVGQKFSTQGPLRAKFYADVMERAEEASALLYVASILLKSRQLFGRRPLTPTSQKTPSGKFSTNKLEGMWRGPIDFSSE